jgi:hypothetical protein
MTPLLVEGAELFKLGDALLELRHADKDAPALRSPAPRLPKGDAPIQERTADRGRGEGARRQNLSTGAPSGVLGQPLEGVAGFVQRGELADKARHSSPVGVAKNLAFRNVPISWEH